MNDHPEFDVFLAHNTLDKPFVRDIAKRLRRSRLNPWLDEEAILPGQIIQEEIQKIIPRIKSAAIFIGKHGLGRWQKVELRSFYTQCVEKGITVIPILLPDVHEFPSELVFLKEHKWVSFVKGSDKKQELQQLKLAIRQQRPIRKPIKNNRKTTLLDKAKKPSASNQKRPDNNVADSYLISKQSLNTSKAQDIKVPSTTNTNSKLPITKVSSRRKSNQTIASKSISSSGAWVLLDNKLFLTKSVDTQADLSVILHISSAAPEQEAALRNLQPEQQYYKKQISFAYQNEAAIMQVESVHTKSIKGKTTFIVILKPSQRTQVNNMMETSLNGYSAEKMAELRARFVLLNELPSATSKSSINYSMIDSWIKGYDNSDQVEKCDFLDLWMKMKNEPQLFLIHARLAAVYHLKIRRIVEHILILKLTLLKNSIISIQFRGQRKPDYINPKPTVIEVKGNCILTK